MQTEKQMGDNFRSIALAGLERHADWLSISSREMTHYVKMLASRPEYETMAEDAMYKALSALRETTSILEAIIHEYQAKGKEGDDSRDRAQSGADSK